MNSNATFTNDNGTTENWIELSRSSPTLPAATRRATMWHPDVSSIPASSTWQDVSGSQLSNEVEDQTLRSEDAAPKPAGTGDDEPKELDSAPRGQK